MIITALVKRYEDNMEIPVGWQKRDATFALEISETGEILDFVPLGGQSGKKRGSLALILPSIGSGRTGILAYQTAYFLCDEGSYILGIDPKKFESSKKLHHRLLENIDTPAANAIKAYFNEPPILPPEKSGNKEYTQAKYVFSFDGKIIDYEAGSEISGRWDNEQKNKATGKLERCLVTGQHDEIIKLHYKIPLRGVTMNAQPLISINNQKSFRSYGSKDNDPPAMMGQYAAFAYSAALSSLLENNKHHKFIGSDTLLYWAEKGGEAEEGLFSDLLDPPKIDDEAELDEWAKRASAGDYVSGYNPECRFHLLCLSPNAARMSVRFFLMDKFGVLASNIKKHYERLEIINDGRNPFTMLPLWLLLSETTIKQKAADANPLLGTQLLNSILKNTPYPFTLYNAILTRIRAGGAINQAKVAIIKATLIKNFSKSEVITVALNEKSENTPYVLGRLFSVLEMLQDRANGSSTIRERYFTSACSNPSSIFPTLLNLSIHHSAKLDNPIFFEKLKSELISRLGGEDPFPAALSLDDQGRFIVGYYHQRQFFFTKKEVPKETTIEEAPENE
ncbi:MAG: type I-C CRISPR-associated protein Cas8c/Csd1 [Clostridiales bacterium]|nr:type I-C CRISPR-associated protein Cas8c/Csd1 [Clostridiales bacterium]